MPAQHLLEKLRSLLPTFRGPIQLRSLNDEALRQLITDQITVFPAAKIRVHHSTAQPTSFAYEFQEKKAFVLHNVQVWPSLGAASTLQGEVIQETAFNDVRLKKIVTWKGLNRKSLSANTGVFTSIEAGTWWDNHYHWLIDSVPRLYALHSPIISKIPTITLLHFGAISQPQSEVYKALLPANVVVQETKESRPVRVGTFIALPYLSGDCAGFLPSEYLQFFRKRIFERYGIADNSERAELIYISRKRATKRKFTNEENLIERLAVLGFKPYELEQMTFQHQVELFSRAKCVVGQHGAGLTNLIFGGRCKVIEIHAGRILNHYRLLAAALGQEYGSLLIHNAEKDRSTEAPIEELLRKCERMKVSGHLDG